MRFLPLPILFSTALAITACSRPGEKKHARAADEAIPVTLAEVRSVPWEKKILLVGTLLPNQQARIAAEVEGSIEKTHAEVGQLVDAGSPLVQIDTASYKGMVNLHAAMVEKAEANAANQTENLERLDQLRRTGAVSPTDYDTAVAAQKQAIAEVAAARAQLGSAQTALRRSLAKAPFAGAITDRQIDQGDFVRPGTIMYQLVDDSVLRFRGEIPERHAGRAKVGQKVRLSVDAYPDREFEGTISWINPAVSPETRGVGVEARVENPDRTLKAHFFARAELITDPAAPTVVIPLDAVLSYVGVNKVFVVENGIAQGREVTLGATVEEQQEILKGVQPGEKVILGGRTKVQPGSRVSVQPSPAAPESPKVTANF